MPVAALKVSQTGLTVLQATKLARINSVSKRLNINLIEYFEPSIYKNYSLTQRLKNHKFEKFNFTVLCDE
jgi:hypothetical protein